MTREHVIETIENLSVSCGSWGRLLRYLEEAREVDPEKYEEIMAEMEKASDPVDLVTMIEC